MRAGPLSKQSVIEKLNAEYINNWIIIPQFENPADHFQDATACQWAKVIKMEFTYPVDTILLSHEGKPIGQGEFEKVYSGNAYLNLISRPR